MKNKIRTGALLLLVLAFATRSDYRIEARARMQAATPGRNPGQLPIDPARWYQLNNVSNGLTGLFDGRTDAPVQTGNDLLLKRYDAYYPLLAGEQLTIDRVRFFDGSGSHIDAPLILSVITDTWERIPIARFTGEAENQWVGPDPARPDAFTLATPATNVRFLVISTAGAFPTELELYGTYTAPPAPTPVPARATPFRQAIGVNAFEWNLEDASSPWQIDESRLEALKGFSAIRHYMDWEKLESTPGQYTFNPTFSGSWNYDILYERLQAEGIDVLACLKTIPKWMENTYPEGQRDYENVPAPYGRDLSQPASYIEQARVAFQYAARYGHTKTVDPALVSVSPVKTWAGLNTVKIGLGLIRYLECDNERDKTWKGRKAYQTAREYAANLSAFYDGHKNTLGPGVGVKNADPTMQVVVGGLAASTTDYIRGMIDWCREFRGYRPDGSIDLCWDVMNQHLYANNARSSQGGGSERGAAPEVSGVGEQAAAFVRVAHDLAGDRPVWITEAGYDTNPGSPLRAIGVGGKSVEQTQADWILRTALLYTRVGIDRLFFYQLYDEDPANPIQFSSMGLLNGDKTRKPAADFLRQANQLLSGYQFSDTVATTGGPAGLIVDRYVPITAGGRRMRNEAKAAYVLLIGDERGRTGTVNLPVAAGDTVQLCIPTAGRSAMMRSWLVSKTGTIPITVSETPVFVMPGAGPPLTETTTSDLSTLQLFPNPTTDYVDLLLTNASEQAVDIRVFDNTGRVHVVQHLQKPETALRAKLTLTALPYGIYFVEVRQGTSRTVRKIIRSH
ncbi:hypothetical protein GCM10027578_17940 [Spirosoma luteolum]